MSEPQGAVTVRGLVKRYKSVEAVAGIDLDVRPGETFGFLGPNGAGKSTTIKILCTLVDATAGSAAVAGFDVARERDQVRRHIGLVFQEPTLDAYLTAEQNLKFHGELYGVDRATAATRRQEVLTMVGLWERRGDHRAGPPDPGLDLGVHRRAAPPRADHRVRHHPLHGRGRALRPHRHHQRGPDRDRKSTRLNS